MNIETQTLEHGVTIVTTSGPASRSRYTETYYHWSILDIRGHYIIAETYAHISMAINVHEYARGGKRMYRLTYTYA